MYITTAGELVADLTQSIGVGGIFNGVKWSLFLNDVFPNQNSEVADFVIDDFGGIVNSKAVVWQTPFLNQSGQAEVRGAMLSWLTTYAPDPSVIAYGWVELNAGGDTVVRAERFAEPFTFSRGSQELSLVPAARKGNT